uniref:Methyltransferase type 11 domain-containing protein n=1 Tax=Rhizochromulina marina TaxID=1034831 RepID=A0A7S2S6T0_9STRA|mmetsp:Transcript_25950/g.75640  ORF Transcript_25950/g.75640 Transcript_25950/m.75640 type:complete len:294 (+) Transcript_25950:3-884(+)
MMALRRLGLGRPRVALRGFHATAAARWGGEYYADDIMHHVDQCLDGLEHGGFYVFQGMLHGADDAVVRWIASRLMYPRTDSPQARRMMDIMNRTNAYAGLEVGKSFTRSLQGVSHRPVRILEVGFGGGHALINTTKLCAEHNWRVLGVDHSEDSLAFTKRAMVAAQCDAGVYDLMCADISRGLWAIPDGAFDCVYHCNTWYYWQDLDSTVEEIARLTRPGGIILSTSKAKFLKLLFGSRLASIEDKLLHTEVGRYEAALRSAGIKEVNSFENHPPTGEDPLSQFTMTFATKSK